MLKAVKNAVVGVIGRERANRIVGPYYDWRARQQTERVLGTLPAGGLRVNIGCGPVHLNGWVNLDIARNEAVDVVWDLRDGLPFADNSATAIFGEHIIEHMPKEAATKLARECWRVLEPGGVLRLSTPDAELYLRSYASDQQFLHHASFPFPVATALDRINQMMREDGLHHWAYDAETLTQMLCKAGFQTAVKQSFGVSTHPQMQGLDAAIRAFESLYVEAIK